MKALNAMSHRGIDDFFGHLGSFVLDGNFDKLEIYMTEDHKMVYTYWVDGERKIVEDVHVFDGPADYEYPT